MTPSKPLFTLSAALFGTVAYLLGLVSLLYLIGFVENAFVPKSIDTGGPGGESVAVAVLIDAALIALFGLQHSVMARPAFKKAWTRIVPAPIERSTYVLFASAVLSLLMWQWRPIDGAVWGFGPAGSAVMIAISGIGWALLFLSTFLINHFELFGLRQTFARIFNLADAEPAFRTPFLYRVVRHPLYLGFLLAMWAAPTMTLGHLLFSSLMTAYIVLAIGFEEKDLIGVFGSAYVNYREKVGMLFPRLRRG